MASRRVIGMRLRQSFFLNVFELAVHADAVRFPLQELLLLPGSQPQRGLTVQLLFAR